MIANPEKFQALLISKRKTNFTDIPIHIDGKNIKVKNCVKLLGVKIDDRLNFDSHIKDICMAAASKLNSLIRLSTALGFKEKKVLIESFIFSQFDYCPIVWHFSTAKSTEKN